MLKKIFFLVLCTTIFLQTAIGENIVFYGDSIIESYDWQKAFENHNITTIGYVGKRVKDIAKHDYFIKQIRPDKIFFLGGINNLASNKNHETFMQEYEDLFKNLIDQNKLYIISILPVSEKHRIKNKNIESTNESIQKLCQKYNQFSNIEYIDLYSFLKKSIDDGEKIFMNDGLHLNSNGYQLFVKYLQNYIKN